MIQCLIFFCLFLSFSVLFFAHAHMACVFACLPLDRPDHSGFLLLVIQPSIHLDIHPIPSHPAHSCIRVSIHPCIHSHSPFFIQFNHPNASQPSCCVHLFDPSERLMRKCPVHSSLSYSTCVHPSCRLCKPSTLLVCTFVPWKRRPSIQSREARQ